MAKIEEQHVLLYSGGLDSFILRKMGKFHHILYFDTGTVDGNRERERLDAEVKVIPFPISQFELPNKIIPFRNYLFALCAANYGNIITIGTTLGDTTRDKDYVFQSYCNGILNYFGAVKEKMPYIADRFELQMPFKNSTKAGIVRLYLSEGYNPTLLKQSRSCYEGEDTECGECRSCLRKYVAFKANDITSLLDFAPPRQGLLVNLYEESVRKGRHPIELEEIVHCYTVKGTK